MITDNMFLAHFQTKQTILIHGSSGFGKSALVKAFAQNHGFNYIERRVLNIDPLNLCIPHKDEVNKVLIPYPDKWVKDLCDDPSTGYVVPKTVLFLDEFNRPMSDQTFGMFTEMLLDRTFMNTYKLSDNVLILAAANLETEDIGVRDLPDAVIKRVTHVVHAPSVHAVARTMRSKLATEMLQKHPKLFKEPGSGEEVWVKLSESPRQLDQALEIAETGLLSRDETRHVFVGKMGLEHGNARFQQYCDIVDKRTTVFPLTLTQLNFEAVSQLEAKGLVNETIGYLQSQESEMAAHYLLTTALPETCRGMFSYGEFRHTLKHWPTGLAHVADLDPQNWAWDYIAVRIGKLGLARKSS